MTYILKSGCFSNNWAVDLHRILAYLMGRRPGQIIALNTCYSRAVDLSPYLKVFTVGALMRPKSPRSDDRQLIGYPLPDFQPFEEPFL